MLRLTGTKSVDDVNGLQERLAGLRDAKQAARAERQQLRLKWRDTVAQRHTLAVWGEWEGDEFIPAESDRFCESWLSTGRVLAEFTVSLFHPGADGDPKTLSELYEEVESAERAAERDKTAAYRRHEELKIEADGIDYLMELIEEETQSSEALVRTALSTAWPAAEDDH